MTLGRALRCAAAIAILIGGIVHLDLYFDGYRAIPDIGRSFMANAVASGVVAAALVVRREWFVRVAAMLLATATVVAFALSRRGNGLFHFRESGLQPSPQAGLMLVVEIAAVVLLALSFVRGVARRDASFRLPLLGASAATVAVVMAGFGVSAANDGASATASSAAGGAAAVTISDFAFHAPELTIPAGTTVTWTNDDGVRHSVDATDGTFGSERLARGDSVQFTFETDGTFAYVCNIHPDMNGTIIVSG
jgi:plastocyanin